jgi:hypothetical protein
MQFFFSLFLIGPGPLFFSFSLSLSLFTCSTAQAGLSFLLLTAQPTFSLFPLFHPRGPAAPPGLVRRVRQPFSPSPLPLADRRAPLVGAFYLPELDSDSSPGTPPARLPPCRTEPRARTPRHLATLFKPPCPRASSPSRSHRLH